MNAHIYLVTNNISGKQYVGQTTVENNRVGHGLLVTQAYKAHGRSNFTYERICGNVNNRKTLNFLERFWIKVMDSKAPNGYNIEDGGTDKGEIAESTRQKLRNFNLGKTIPIQTRQKISNSLKGDKNPFYGKTHTPEAMEKIIAANVGKVVVISEETKEKIRQTKIGSKNPMYGKQITDEHRKKLQENNARNRYWLGKKFSNEQKAHLSQELICPHCNKIGKGNAMRRYHMDKCKLRVTA